MHEIKTLVTLSMLGTVAVVAAACGAGQTAVEDAVPDRSGAPAAQTTGGALEGAWADEAAGISVFRGVAFAQPPVGGLRWRPPAPIEPLEGTTLATEFGPACWQARNPDDSPYSRGELQRSEDCLTLNVWSPASAGERRPVMVWFHGGGHNSGVGSAKIFDGTAMAKKGVLMVTANYRLGPFGFLAHPALTAESEHAASGNYGILDHVATLTWVRDNIAAFGGDPDNVTIFGQSAGSWSICALQATPLARGLFHRAIGHSGGCFGAPRPHLSVTGGVATAESGHDVGLAIASELKVEGADPAAAAALRAATPDAVMAAEAAAGTGAGMVVDGWVLPKLADDIFAAGEQNDVPVILGSLSDEGTTLFAGMPEPPHDEFVASIRNQYGSQADALLAAYADDVSSSTRTAGQAIAADRSFTWQMRAWARAMGDTNDVYLYHFSHAPPVFRLYRPEGPELDYAAGRRGAGAYHSCDLAYAFANVGLVGIEWNDRDRELSAQMSQYWVNFATTGNPNGEGLPEWPKYDRGAESAIHFATDGTTATAKVREAKLDLFDSGYTVGGN
ncbi:MAG: carboxylesterase family protein [Acidobacteria bacterium]|nr:carboxylesterase family protein [Acidobacteriota bacterium]